MKISFAITVCNEIEEIKRLVLFLFEHKRKEDEIVILYDEKNGNPEILDFLLPYNKFPHVQTWRGFDFEGMIAGLLKDQAGEEDDSEEEYSMEDLIQFVEEVKNRTLH